MRSYSYQNNWSHLVTGIGMVTRSQEAPIVSCSISITEVLEKTKKVFDSCERFF